MGSGTSRNVIGVRLGLAQSRDHDHQPLDLPPVRERDTPQSGGEILDYGTKSFITNMNQGQYVGGLGLQEARNDSTRVAVLSPGENYERMGMRVGDAYLMVIPNLGESRVWVIQDKKIDRGFRVRLVLKPELDYTPQLGALPRRGTNIPPGDGGAPKPLPPSTPEGPYGYAEG